MDFGILNLLQILGSTAFFIYGMKVMSEGIQKAAGKAFRKILNAMTKTRLASILSGFLTTAALQTSSATTVMTVSIVNAGLVGLPEAAGLIMGANIGTTITAWLAFVLSYRVNLDLIAIPLLCIAVPMYFVKMESLRYWGEAIIGFAIILISLRYLGEAMPDIEDNLEVFNWVKRYTTGGIGTYMLFILIGMVATWILQSSSASMVLTTSLCISGWLPFDVAAAMILGENVGTTITAEIAAIVANVEGKRAARFHTLFNTGGALWMILVLPLFLSLIKKFLHAFDVNDPTIDPQSVDIGLAMFHTSFNVLNTIVFLMIFPLVMRVLKRMLPDTIESKQLGLKYIASQNKSPELSLVELKTELVHMGEIVTRMMNSVKQYLNSVDSEEQQEVQSKIKKYREVTGRMKKELLEYSTALSKEKMSQETSEILKIQVSICYTLEELADMLEEMADSITHKIDRKVWFSPAQRNTLNTLFGVLDHAMNEYLSLIRTTDNKQHDLTTSLALHKKAQGIMKTLKDESMIQSDEEQYSSNNQMIFNTLVAKLDYIVKKMEDIIGHLK